MKTSTGIIFSKSNVFIATTENSNGEYLFRDHLEIGYKNQYDALKELKKTLKRSNKIILGISHHNCKIQINSIDSKLSDNEIVMYLSAKLLNQYFDYEIINSSAKLSRLRIVSASKQYINEQINIFKKVGINLSAIDLNIFGLKRLIKQSDSIKNLPKNINKICAYTATGVSLWSANKNGN